MSIFYFFAGLIIRKYFLFLILSFYLNISLLFRSVQCWTSASRMGIFLFNFLYVAIFSQFFSYYFHKYFRLTLNVFQLLLGQYFSSTFCIISTIFAFNSSLFIILISVNIFTFSIVFFKHFSSIFPIIYYHFIYNITSLVIYCLSVKTKS